ncbi:hypothetical protein V2G26_009418 [Clonostachys chloroleuca]
MLELTVLQRRNFLSGEDHISGFQSHIASRKRTRGAGVCLVPQTGVQYINRCPKDPAHAKFLGSLVAIHVMTPLGRFLDPDLQTKLSSQAPATLKPNPNRK